MRLDEETLVTLAVLVALVVIGVLLFAFAVKVLVAVSAPLFLGGIVAYLVSTLAGWLDTRVEKLGGAYRITLYVKSPVETLVAWLIATLVFAALLLR